MYYTVLRRQLDERQETKSVANSQRKKNRARRLTYIIFVYRIWEACHLNEGKDLREKVKYEIKKSKLPRRSTLSMSSKLAGFLWQGLMSGSKTLSSFVRHLFAVIPLARVYFTASLCDNAVRMLQSR